MYANFYMVMFSYFSYSLIQYIHEDFMHSLRVIVYDSFMILLHYIHITVLCYAHTVTQVLFIHIHFLFNSSHTRTRFT